VASAGIDSVSFSWPAGCITELVATEETAGKRLAIRLKPDHLPPQPIVLSTFLNGHDSGGIQVTSGEPTGYGTAGELRAGRNVLEIRCGGAWLEPESRPTITILGFEAIDAQ